MKNNKRAWLIFVGCCLTQMLTLGAVFNTTGLFYGPICDELQVGRGSIAMYITIAELVGIAMAPFWGKKLQKCNVKVMMTVCVGVMGGSLLAMSFGTKLWHWYVAGAAFGLVCNAVTLLITPVLLSNWFEKNLGTVTSVAMCFSGIGGAIMSPVISFLIEEYGWRTAERIVALLPVVVLIPYAIMFFQLHPQDIGLQPYGHQDHQMKKVELVRKNNEPIDLESVLRSPVFYTLMVLVPCMCFGSSFGNYLPSVAQSVGKAAAVGAAISSMCMIGNIVGKLLLGPATDKFGSVSATKLSICVVVVANISLLGACFTAQNVFLYVGGFLTGMALSINSVALPLLVRSVFGNQNYSKIFSYASMASSLSRACATTIAGTLYDISGTYVLSVGLNIILYIIAVFIITRLGKMKQLVEV